MTPTLQSKTGYGSPTNVAQRIREWLGKYAGENSASLLLYEAMKALDQAALAAPAEPAVAGFSARQLRTIDCVNSWLKDAKLPLYAAIPAECTCPSGNGSLRHPCPAHPAGAADKARDFELDMYRSLYGTQAPTNAVTDVLAERRRQIEAEGWTPEHDDEHRDYSLSFAAGCYAMFTMAYPAGDPPPHWPWPAEWWKPKDRRSNLVRACALILAEIERLDRATNAASIAVDHPGNSDA